MGWSEYWVWFAAAIVLGILEIVAPGYILLGFAIAAGLMGFIFLFDSGISAYLADSLPVTLVVFGLAALAVWVLMRKLFGARGGSVKVWEEDINDN
ncbi:MAG: hypothetical protein AAGA08_20670 [Pseudomonadota bacterium]